MSASKILIVEDETAIREMIAFHLVRAGYETIEAPDCRRARELLADERPDLALIDWMLPDMSGLELTRMLKRDSANEDLGIIMLTAKADEFDKVAGLEGGADDYVTKPFAPRELVARIPRTAELDELRTVGPEGLGYGHALIGQCAAEVGRVRGERVLADRDQVFALHVYPDRLTSTILEVVRCTDKPLNWRIDER